MTADASAKKPFHRLPANVVPKHYAITLKPDLKAFSFSGSQLVDIEIKQETDKIVLNALDLQISEANYRSSKGEASGSSNIALSEEDELATISFASPLKPGFGNLIRVGGEFSLVTVYAPHRPTATYVHRHAQ